MTSPAQASRPITSPSPCRPHLSGASSVPIRQSCHTLPPSVPSQPSTPAVFACELLSVRSLYQPRGRQQRDEGRDDCARSAAHQGDSKQPVQSVALTCVSDGQNSFDARPGTLPFWQPQRMCAPGLQTAFLPTAASGRTHACRPPPTRRSSSSTSTADPLRHSFTLRLTRSIYSPPTCLLLHPAQSSMHDARGTSSRLRTHILGIAPPYPIV